MLNELTERIYEINVKNGWYDEERAVADDLILIDTETAEAYEEYRNHREPDEEYYTCKDCKSISGEYADGVCAVCSRGILQPCGMPSEIIDVIVRALDYCKRYNIDADRVMDEKLRYNALRGYRHGGKRT